MSGKKMILAVDDDPDVLAQIEAILGPRGYEVTTAGNQQEAEETILMRRPDLAILDLMMDTPDSGFVLCHYIKKLHPDVPVILLTSVVSETGIGFDVRSEESRGWVKADQILDKPVRAEQLCAEIGRLLREPAAHGHGGAH